MENESEESLIEELWQEHRAAPFPKGFRGKDVNSIDFVVLDSQIAGCVDTFVQRGELNVYQVAMLGLAYRNITYVLPILNDEGAEHFWRLERLAELVLKQVARKNHST
ncbi:MAG: hypothetical protein QOF61_3264 [Acidobacteriota bacterium]|jgi:FAD/FMN-containing dehydrogenase|nr:hypothetical protein [Acidobacteriota bacterium]